MPYVALCVKALIDLKCHAENVAAVGKKRNAIELLNEALSTLQMGSPPLRVKIEIFSCKRYYILLAMFLLCSSY